MKVVVIIPCFGDGPLLRENIKSIDLSARNARKLGIFVDIIVVDNHPIKRIEKKQLRGVDTVLHCRKPGSYSARNFGIAACIDTSDAIIFTDADCFADENWIAECVNALLITDVSIVGGAVDLNLSSAFSLWEHFDYIFGLPQKRYVEQGYAITANLAVSSSVFEEVGLFDDRYFSGGDVEFVKRAVSHGYKLIYSSAARVNHPCRSNFYDIYQKLDRTLAAQTIRAPNKFRVILLILYVLVMPIRYIFQSLHCLDKKPLRSILLANLINFCLTPVRLMIIIKTLLKSPQRR